MLISNNLNRFFNGVVLKQLKEADYLNINGFQLRPKAVSKDSFRQLLKVLDFDYPVAEGKPKSLKDLTSREVCDHILRLERIASNSGFELQYIKEEYEAMLYEAGIIKG